MQCTKTLDRGAMSGVRFALVKQKGGDLLTEIMWVWVAVAAIGALLVAVVWHIWPELKQLFEFEEE